MIFTLYVAAITGLLAYAQLGLKWRIPQLPGLHFNSLESIKATCVTLFDPMVLSCFAALGIAAALYLSILPKFPLNLVYPFMSLNLVFVVLGSSLFLGEPLTAYKIAGTAIIVLGVVVAAQG